MSYSWKEIRLECRQFRHILRTQQVQFNDRRQTHKHDLAPPPDRSMTIG